MTSRNDIKIVGTCHEMDCGDKYFIAKIGLLDKGQGSSVAVGSRLWGYAHIEDDSGKFHLKADLIPNIGKSLYFFDYHLSSKDLVTSSVKNFYTHDGEKGWDKVTYPEDFPIKDISFRVPIRKDDVVFITRSSIYFAQKHKNMLEENKR